MKLTHILCEQSPSTYHPTNHEREVLAIVVNSTTSELASQLLGGDINRSSAASQLHKLGFLTTVDGSTSLTDNGNELATAQGLVDEMGNPTEDSKSMWSSTQ